AIVVCNAVVRCTIVDRERFTSPRSTLASFRAVLLPQTCASSSCVSPLLFRRFRILSPSFRRMICDWAGLRFGLADRGGFRAGLCVLPRRPALVMLDPDGRPPSKAWGLAPGGCINGERLLSSLPVHRHGVL